MVLYKGCAWPGYFFLAVMIGFCTFLIKTYCGPLKFVNPLEFLINFWINLILKLDKGSPVKEMRQKVKSYPRFTLQSTNHWHSCHPFAELLSTPCWVRQKQKDPSELRKAQLYAICCDAIQWQSDESLSRSSCHQQILRQRVSLLSDMNEFQTKQR